MIRPADPRHITWSPDNFYWALIDLTRMGNDVRRGSDQQLGYLFEAVLPVPIEDVHAVYHRVDSQRILACGIDRTRLSPVLDSGALTLTPSQLPTHVGDVTGARQLNLLIGTYLPRPIARLRTRIVALAALIAMTATAIVIVGLERRTTALNAGFDALRRGEVAIMADVLDPVPLGSAPLPPERRLAAELARLEQTRRPSASTSALARGGATGMLTGLLGRWPQELHVQTNALSVTPDAMTVAAQVATMADAQRLATALDAPAGWLIDLPQTEARANHVDVTIRFRPTSESETP